MWTWHTNDLSLEVMKRLPLVRVTSYIIANGAEPFSCSLGIRVNIRYHGACFRQELDGALLDRPLMEVAELVVAEFLAEYRGCRT